MQKKTRKEVLRCCLFLLIPHSTTAAVDKRMRIPKIDPAAMGIILILRFFFLQETCSDRFGFSHKLQENGYKL